MGIILTTVLSVRGKLPYCVQHIAYSDKDNIIKLEAMTSKYITRKLKQTEIQKINMTKTNSEFDDYILYLIFL